MPVLLLNALLTVARVRYSVSTGASSAPAEVLADVPCHIGPLRASAFTLLPEAALKAEYLAKVAPGTDIATGDQITAITLPDGLTPWPGDYSRATAVPGSDPTSVWWVSYHVESTPGPLAHRTLYLARITGGGPLHP